MRRSLPLLLVLLAAAGCGQAAAPAEDFRGEDRRVAQKVEDLQEAGSESDAARICNQLLSSGARGRIEARGVRCEQVIEDALRNADSFELDTRDVAITGDRATVRVRSGGDDQEIDTLTLVREGGDWRFERLG